MRTIINRHKIRNINKKKKNDIKKKLKRAIPISVKNHKVDHRGLGWKGK